MKIVITLFFALLTGVFSVSAQEMTPVKKIRQLQIGEKAPAQNLIMLSTSGYYSTIKNECKGNGLVVIFSCNTCPYVLAWENRYNKIAERCIGASLGFIIVNSNEAQRDSLDSFEAMQAKAKEMGYTFNYFMDSNHVLADAIGASKTPDVFLFNRDMELVYKGAIDDDQEIEYVGTAYLPNAATSLIQNRPIEIPVTKAIGCSIKRTEKVEIVLD